MSSLAAGFVARMRKRGANTQGETTLGSKVPGEKRPKRSGLNEEVQKSPQASATFPNLEGATQVASKEACASLEDGILAEGPPSIDNVVSEAPSVVTVVGLPLSSRQFNLTIGSPHKLRGPDKLVLNSPAKPIDKNQSTKAIHSMTMHTS